MPPKKSPVISARPTTRVGNKDCIVGLPDMPNKRSSKEEVAAKKKASGLAKADKEMADLLALKKIAAIKDAQRERESEYQTNADNPKDKLMKRIPRTLATVNNG
jgi:hypothetical protein